MSLHQEDTSALRYRHIATPKERRLGSENIGYANLGQAIHLAACAALISRFSPRVRAGYNTGMPPKALWLALVYTEAAWAGVSPVAVININGNDTSKYARWRVWRVLRLMGYSLPGIGRASGRDHTTILHGLNRLGEWVRPEDIQ